MKFILEVGMDNAAFADGRANYELMRLLAKTGRQIVHLPLDGEEHPIKDLNGNTVGTWKVVEDDDTWSPQDWAMVQRAGHAYPRRRRV